MERDEWLRAAWRVAHAAQIDLGCLVFIDEMITDTSLSALRVDPGCVSTVLWVEPPNKKMMPCHVKTIGIFTPSFRSHLSHLREWSS
jgi:hypothetical protein